MANILDSGVKLVRNVGRYSIGSSSLGGLDDLLARTRRESVLNGGGGQVIFLVDQYFKPESTLLIRLGYESGDTLEFISTINEPKTDDIDLMIKRLYQSGFTKPAAIVGMGGGITMDYAKAISNLLANGGKAADYQGWDLVKGQVSLR